MSSFLILLWTCWSLLVAADTDIFIPQVAAGRDPVSGLFFKTTFHMWNLSNEEVSGRIELFKNNGEPMNGFIMVVGPPAMLGYTSSGTFSIPPNGSFMPPTATEWASFALQEIPYLVGWAKVTTSSPVGLIVTIAALSRDEFKSYTVVTSTSLVTETLTAFSTFGLIDYKAATGLAILNPSETKQREIHLHLFDTFGIQRGERTLTLLPRGKIVQFLHEEAFFPELRDKTVQGPLEVTADGPIAAAAIRVDDTYWSGFQLISQSP
ncbi:MAG: hypothetical protein ACE15E_24000 [Acidobacteriota bacterium]